MMLRLPIRMQSQRPYSRMGAILSLIGAACVLLGFFLPLLIRPAGEVAVSEWQLLLYAFYRWPLFAPSALKSIWQAILLDRADAELLWLRFGLLGPILTLPLLSALAVLGTSASACFKLPSFRLLTLRRIAAINGLFIQSVIAIVVLSPARGQILSTLEPIGPGLVLLLLGFLLTVVGAWLSKIPRPTPQQEPVSPPLQPSRIGAILSLLGGALVIFGVLFFPMLSSRGFDASEWFVVNDLMHGYADDQAAAGLFALPLLSVLLVLGTSAAGFLRELSLEMVIWRRVAAIEGLIIQCLLGLNAYLIYSFGLLYSGSTAQLDFGEGFALVLLGFLVMSVGTFLN